MLKEITVLIIHSNFISYKIVGDGFCQCLRHGQCMNKSQKKKAGCTISWSNARAPTVLKDGRPRSPCHFLPCRALVICRQDAVEVISIKDFSLCKQHVFLLQMQSEAALLVLLQYIASREIIKFSESCYGVFAQKCP